MRTNVYQAYNDKHNKSMQDINKEIERERVRIANTRDLFRGSSTLALHPRLRHTKDSTMLDPNGSLLGAATPTSSRTP